jgi:transcriptional regulator with PAS, ATPase and Fis domain
VRKAYETGQLRKENRQLKAALRYQQGATHIIGESPQMQEMFRLIARVGPTNKPILIQGESGTGKELVARALHEASPLADKPLVVINCAALPETLLESELFGYEKGAFTGATGMKPGLFEVADGGTLFIDEIGELAQSLQAKLLRVLEDGTLRRVGSVKERRVHVRLLAATNRDLQEEVQQKRFREDLFYRINVLTLQLPPLRERAGDLALLVEHFTSDEWQLDPDVVPTLERYSWPGNVRQLQNAIDRAKILADDDRIRVDNLPPEIVNTAQSRPRPLSDDVDLDTLTREHVLDTYRRHGSNKAQTARALGIGRRTLYRLLEKYSIDDTETEGHLTREH